MKNSLIAGIVLILLGAVVLGYRGFSYKSREKIIDIGPIQASAETTKTVPVPPILGWALIGSGAAVLVFGYRGKKSA